MKISFINKLPKKNNIIHISSREEKGNIKIESSLDIIKLSKSINTIIDYNTNMNKEVIFNLRKLNKDKIDAFIYKIVQGLYSFNKYKNNNFKRNIKFHAPHYKAQQNKIINIVNSANITRDLINEPANKITPEKFSRYVKMYFKKSKRVNIKILNDKHIKKLGLNLIHAVGGYSHNKPRVVILEYKPLKYTKTICLAGKGVTIDTGGYSVKNVQGMNNMHMDKEGACVGIGIFDNLVKQNSKKRIICLCPLVENIVSNASTKPKDVVTAYNGQTVEIVNVDAEGRLILADTLAYICKNYNPDYIFDIATLTSASDVYCHSSFSYFTINEKLSNIASKQCLEIGEKIIRIPPWLEYMEYIKSNIADVKNSGYKCKKSDDFMASLFLMNFVEKKYRNNWIHFDVRMMSDNNELNIAEGFGTILKIINNI